MENIKEFFNTFTILDFYGLFDNLDIVGLLSNGWVIFSVILLVGLLFSPIKSYVATTLYYLVIVFVALVGWVILKNSDFSDTEKFTMFCGVLVCYVGYYVYNNLIRS